MAWTLTDGMIDELAFGVGRLDGSEHWHLLGASDTVAVCSFASAVFTEQPTTEALLAKLQGAMVFRHILYGHPPEVHTLHVVENAPPRPVKLKEGIRLSGLLGKSGRRGADAAGELVTAWAYRSWESWREFLDGVAHAGDAESVQRLMGAILCKPTEEAAGEPFGPCPDCNLELEVVLDDEKHATAVIHPMPMCPSFEGMTATDFLNHVIDVREAARRQAINE